MKEGCVYTEGKACHFYKHTGRKQSQQRLEDTVSISLCYMMLDEEMKTKVAKSICSKKSKLFIDHLSCDSIFPSFFFLSLFLPLLTTDLYKKDTRCFLCIYLYTNPHISFLIFISSSLPIPSSQTQDTFTCLSFLCASSLQKLLIVISFSPKFPSFQITHSRSIWMEYD